MEKCCTSLQNSDSRYYVLGVPIDGFSMAETLSKIDEFIEEKKPHLIITVNAVAVMLAQKNEEFMQYLYQAALVTPDGAGITWAVRKRCGAFLDRVSGIDIAEKLCERSSEKGYRIFLLGSDPGVAEDAAKKMRERHPNCQIVRTQHGYFSENETEEVARKVALARPDILLVALGMPRQEKFILETTAIHQTPVSIGIGGSLDVFSGKTKRAPKLLQQLSLEWLWRIALNPRKIQVIKQLPQFAFKVIRSKS